MAETILNMTEGVSSDSPSPTASSDTGSFDPPVQLSQTADGRNRFSLPRLTPTPIDAWCLLWFLVGMLALIASVSIATMSGLPEASTVLFVVAVAISAVTFGAGTVAGIKGLSLKSFCVVVFLSVFGICVASFSGARLISPATAEINELFLSLIHI